LRADASVDTDFDPGSGAEAASGDASVNCMAFAPDGSIVVGGEFSRFGGQPRRNLARLRGTVELPKITQDPVSVAATPGSALTLAVRASGPPPLAFQWLKDGVALPGESRSTLGLPRVASNDTGTYSVRVSSAAGVVVSAKASVVVDQSVGLTAGN